MQVLKDLKSLSYRNCIETRRSLLPGLGRRDILVPIGLKIETRGLSYPANLNPFY